MNYKEMLSEMNSSNSNNDSVTGFGKEPNWMVKILGANEAIMTKSTNLNENGANKFIEFAPVYDHKLNMQRNIEKSSYSIMPDGGVTGHDLQVVLAAPSIGTEIQQAFFENIGIKEIVLIRLGIIDQVQEVLEQYTFKSSYVTGLLSKGDMMCVSFRYGNVARTKAIYTIEDGKATKDGSKSAEHNLITSKSLVS